MKPNWEERTSRLAIPSNFHAKLVPSNLLEIQLDYDEWIRLNLKMRLVEESARRQAAGMLKGTLKYENDALSREAWLAHLESELLDANNYLRLMEWEQ